jgi:hypothetical protein
VAGEPALGENRERENNMVSKHLKVILWLGILSFALSSAAWCQYPMKAKTGKGQANGERAEYISLPKHLDAEQIDTIIAGLSDEQVRKIAHQRA